MEFYPLTHRLSQHIGSATQPSQIDTTKSVGKHFRMQGHDVRSDLLFLPIEKISKGAEPFLRKARESFFIKKFQTLKMSPVDIIEHGLNLDKGQ